MSLPSAAQRHGCVRRPSARMPSPLATQCGSELTSMPYLSAPLAISAGAQHRYYCVLACVLQYNGGGQRGTGRGRRRRAPDDISFEELVRQGHECAGCTWGVCRACDDASFGELVRHGRECAGKH